MTTQFKGESNWDAIVNDNSLDIEEEDDFYQFALSNGASKNSSLAELEDEYRRWEESRRNG